MKIYMLTDTHFGIYLNNLDKWQNMMEDTFYSFVIPYLKKNVKEGDILIHLGDLFDNRNSLPIITINKVEKILTEISKILPVHIMVGNHDLYNPEQIMRRAGVNITNITNKLYKTFMIAA